MIFGLLIVHRLELPNDDVLQSGKIVFILKNMRTLIKGHVLKHFIKVFTVCQSIPLRVPVYKGLLQIPTNIIPPGTSRV